MLRHMQRGKANVTLIGECLEVTIQRCIPTAPVADKQSGKIGFGAPPAAARHMLLRGGCGEGLDASNNHTNTCSSVPPTADDW